MKNSQLFEKKRSKSFTAYQDGCEIIPGGVNSPVRAFLGLDLPPLVISKGKGALIWDIDDHVYIDYCCGWGSLILGHSHPVIVQAVIEQLQKGSSFGMTTLVEYELAKKISSHIPSIQKIRFVSSGTEATMSAIRLARGYSGKDKIVKFEGHYHGHSDGLLNCKGIPHGYSQYTLSLPFNETEVCRRLLRNQDGVAAVIIEPVAGNMGVVPGEAKFMQMLREETEKSGIILIFDEVITGFRLGLSGAQGFYGIVPDLTCLGKIVGGGFPCAAFGGKKEIMDALAPLGEVYQAGTLSGNPVAMRAGLKQIEQLEHPLFYQNLEEKSNLVVASLRKMIHDKKINGCVNQIGSMFSAFFGHDNVSKKELLDEKMYKNLFTHLFESGIFFPPSPYETAFLSAHHSHEQIEQTCKAVLSFNP